MVLQYVLFAICGFISGSIMYSYLIAKYFYNVDITIEGSDGNPGMTNVMECVGIKQGLVCLVLDWLKGFVPVLLACTKLDTSDRWFALVIVAPVLGHAFSPMLKGKGGKAIAVTFGVFAGTLIAGSDMFWSLCAILIVFSAIVIIKPHSVRMIFSMIWQIVWCIVKRESLGLMFGGVFSSIIVIIKHIMNKDKEKVRVELPFKKSK